MGATDLYGAEDAELMYQSAIGRPLAEKVEQAVALIQAYEGQALQLSLDGYYVCFSGGKDSIVLAKLFELAGVKHQLHYANVTIDPPQLVRFIKKQYPQAIWHSVGTPLPYYMAQKNNGPPTRIARWCCEVYKERNSPNLFSAIGVRAQESARRKGLWRQVAKDKKSAVGMILCPILYWTEHDVWTFIRQYQMAYCELYDPPYNKRRLGCIGCPMGGPQQQLADFQLWPGYERLWRRGFQKYWDTFKGTKTNQGKERWMERFETVEELWQWWIKKGAEGDQADCQLWLW